MINHLTPFEARVLGVLLEKRFTTPDAYPLSLNSLVLGCNQLTARDPIMALSEAAVQDTLELLHERKLIAPRQQAGARVIKYEHRLNQHVNLDDEMLAVFCVLLLRGPQTLGELKQRTERMVGFAELAQVLAALDLLAGLSTPFVLPLPKAPGTKELRYAACVAGVSFDAAQAHDPTTVAGEHEAGIVAKGRLGELEDEVARLKRDLDALTHAFLDFKAGFG